MQTGALARHIGVGRTTLFNWKQAGLLPAPERRGRTAIYSPAAVSIARSLAESAR
jgi:DNA-binding transcriptional MerR regulator